jgi:hypothetical protein
MRFLANILVTLWLLSSFPGLVFAVSPEKLDILKLPECRVTTSSLGGKLLLSNSPEMVKKDGILYQDVVVGSTRLFLHHVNAADTARRIVIVLENSGDEDADVVISRYGFGGPGFDWLAVGKEAIVEYLADGGAQPLTVPSKFTIPLPGCDDAVLPNMAVSAIFDFVVDRPVTVKVMMMPVLEDSWTFSRRAAILPFDENHLRGTFSGADRRLTFSKEYDPRSDGAMALTLADNKIDRYLEGVDATDGSRVTNYGNYGVVYQIFPYAKNSGKVAYYINPRGGTYAGAVGVACNDAEQVLIETPGGKTFFGEDKYKDFASLGVFDSNALLCFTFSPPGASNLPVKLVIMPQE